jgi:hypothetical protein
LNVAQCTRTPTAKGEFRYNVTVFGCCWEQPVRATAPPISFANNLVSRLGNITPFSGLVRPLAKRRGRWIAIVPSVQFLEPCLNFPRLPLGQATRETFIAVSGASPISLSRVRFVEPHLQTPATGGIAD